jgi:hypothetical protein
VIGYLRLELLLSAPRTLRHQDSDFLIVVVVVVVVMKSSGDRSILVRRWEQDPPRFFHALDVGNTDPNSCLEFS